MKKNKKVSKCCKAPIINKLGDIVCNDCDLILNDSGIIEVPFNFIGD